MQYDQPDGTTHCPCDALQRVQYFGAHIGEFVSLDDLLLYLVNSLQGGVRAARISVFLHEPDTDLLEMAAVSGIGLLEGGGRTFRMNEGLAGEAAASRMPCWTNDTSTDPRYVPGSSGDAPRRLIAIPLLTGHTLVGVLNIERGMDTPPFAENEMAVLRMVASQASIQITNVQLREDVERRLVNLAIVREISNMLLSSRSMAELLDNLVMYVGEILSVSTCLLFQARQDGMELVLRSCWGERPHIRSAIPLGTGLVGWAATKDGPVIIQSPREHGKFQKEYEYLPDAHSLVCVPLFSRGELLGVLAVANLERSRTFGSMDVELLTLLAQQASVALENVRLQNRLQELATTDELTGLMNRRLFRDNLVREEDRSRRYGHPLSLMMVDIDHFKSVNDEFGHLIGDIVLSNLGAIIRHVVRKVDSPARFGGEEFAILMPETDREGALLTAERLRTAVEEANLFEGRKRRDITVSIGVATLPGDGVDGEGLIRAADDALYAAKESGRNRVVTAS